MKLSYPTELWLRSINAYRYFLLSIMEHIIIFRGPHWLLTVPCTSFSSEYEYTITHTHTHSSAQLRQLQCSSISTYLYKLPIAEVHSITVCSLHARRNWDTLTLCSLMAAGRAVFILIIAQAQTPLINNSASWRLRLHQGWGHCRGGVVPGGRALHSHLLLFLTNTRCGDHDD